MSTHHRFFQDIESDNGLVNQSEAHHIKKVLRLKPGDIIFFQNGSGTEWECSIQDLDPVRVEIRNTTVYPLPKPFLRLILASIKPNSLEYALEKACEVGVDEIIITKTQFSQIPLEVFTKKQPRLERILQTASKQSERTFLPTLHIQPLSEINFSQSEYNLIGTTQYSDAPIRLIEVAPADSITLFIGPEGGFSQSEYQELILTYTPVTFGTYILRSETAAIVGTAILAQHKLRS